MSIKIEGLTHTYMAGTALEATAIKDINLVINEGEFVGLMGHTGSGKSTLIQHFNGILKPTQGTIKIDDVNIHSSKLILKKVRQKVGLVFQYPEHQLFEETVFSDVAFGPKNIGVNEDEIEERVKNALLAVGMDYDSIKDHSPFELSGGQKRRIAIAGVLAMKPEVLILDEPTAGLDPRSRYELLEEIKRLHKSHGITVILVSHSMENLAEYTKRIIAMANGTIILDGTPHEVFREWEKLQAVGLGVPDVTRLMFLLRNKGLDINTDVLNVEDAKREIIKMLKGRELC